MFFGLCIICFMVLVIYVIILKVNLWNIFIHLTTLQTSNQKRILSFEKIVSLGLFNVPEAEFIVAFRP